MVTKEQLAQLRKSAPANTKLTVSRKARTPKKPPKIAYRGTGNIQRVIKSEFPDRSLSEYRFIERTIMDYANRFNSGELPSTTVMHEITEGL